jgi:Protein of unknown function (DUF1566)
MNPRTIARSILFLGLAAACGPVQATPSITASPSSAPRLLPGVAAEAAVPYTIVDTEQTKCYDAQSEADCGVTTIPGQDAQYAGAQPRYQDNGDGTVTDLNTGLMWQADPGRKMTYAQAVEGAPAFRLAGHDDWRLPSIKDLYSLILFDGTDASSCLGACTLAPFIDTRSFGFSYGDESRGERIIDSQFVSSTRYVSTTMNGADTVFGVNFADGRIKGYPAGPMPGQPSGKLFYVLYVRGNPEYGHNLFVDNKDGTITDEATGLTWMQSDSGAGMDWPQALVYCEGATTSGYEDWRLPNAKELQSIVDYSRSPDASNSAAIDPRFQATAVTNEAGQEDYPFYWTSTTHVNSAGSGEYAAYISFGRAMGYMGNAWIDVHGAGAQRSDPKTGETSAHPEGHGPQGDSVRIQNYVRCVRGGVAVPSPEGGTSVARPTMTVQSTGVQQGQGSGPPGPGAAQGSGQQPPQAAIDACAGAAPHSACEFGAPNGTVSGTCRQIQQQLACVPQNAR